MTTSTKTMTKAQFFTNLVKYLRGEDVMEGCTDATLLEYAEAEIVKIEEAARRAAERKAEKSSADAPLFDALLGALNPEAPLTATAAGEMLEISTQKASALLRKLVAEGKARVEDIKVEKRTCKAYYAVV